MYFDPAAFFISKATKGLLHKKRTAGAAIYRRTVRSDIRCERKNSLSGGADANGDPNGRSQELVAVLVRIQSRLNPGPLPAPSTSNFTDQLQAGGVVHRLDQGVGVIAQSSGLKERPPPW